MTLLSSLTLSDGEGSIFLDLYQEGTAYVLRIKSILYEIDEIVKMLSLPGIEDYMQKEKQRYMKLGFKVIQQPAKGNPYPRGRWTA